MLGYRERILEVCSAVLETKPTPSSALDFGSGDGWFASAFARRGFVRHVVPVDVMKRTSCLVEPLLYSGDRLPFADRTFDLVYTMDVLHHCNSPQASLKELLRCAKRYVLIKDHVYNTPFERTMLCALDEIGNRRHGVASPFKFQRSWEWNPVLTGEGFVQESLVHPANCHPPALQWLFGKLQYVALWRRIDEAA